MADLRAVPKAFYSVWQHVTMPLLLCTVYSSVRFGSVQWRSYGTFATWGKNIFVPPLTKLLSRKCKIGAKSRVRNLTAELSASAVTFVLFRV